MKRFTVITDPGIDDLIAFLLLYKLSSNSKVQLVSCFGNISEKYTFQNAKEFIALTNAKWQLAHGSSLPLEGEFNPKKLFELFGTDGVRDIHVEFETSSVEIVKTISPAENIISLGSMTDLHKILSKDNKEAQKVTIMGGVFNEAGNYTKHSECNIAFDPKAASLFFNNFKNLKVRVIPLNITKKTYWPHDLVKRIPETSKINIWIKKIILDWYQKRDKIYKIHDPLAIYLHFYPQKAVWKETGVRIILSSKKRGKTEFDKKNPICNIALDIKNPDKIAEEIFNIVFS